MLVGIRRRRARAWFRLQCALVVALLVAGASPVYGTSPGGPPVYVFAPSVLTPGGPVTVWGAQFNPAHRLVRVALGDGHHPATLLGYASVSTGAFTQSFTVPASLTAGIYGLSVVDFAGQLALNLTGTLTLTPRVPFVRFAPTTVAPGESIAVSVANYPLTSTAASVSLVDGTGRVILVGATPMVGGGFAHPFTVPASVTPGSYMLLVQDAGHRPAQNLTGPLTLAFPRTLPTVNVGFYPVGVAVDPSLHQVYVPNAGVNTVSIVDSATQTVVAVVPVGSMPCAIAANPLTHRVYVADVDTNDVAVLDGVSRSLLARIPVGGYPCAIGVTTATNRVFVGNGRDNTVSVLDGGTNAVIATVPTGRAPVGIGTNQRTSRVYVANGSDNSVTVLDGQTDTVVATATVGPLPDAVGVDAQANRVYVANYHSRTMTVLDGGTNAYLATVLVGSEPDAIDVMPGTHHVYVANYASNSVTVIDGGTNKALASVPVGVTPDGLAVNPATSQVYVANSNSNTVSVLSDVACCHARSTAPR